MQGVISKTGTPKGIFVSKKSVPLRWKKKQKLNDVERNGRKMTMEEKYALLHMLYEKS